TGPGKVGAALGLDTSFSGRALYRRAGLHVLDAEPPTAVLVGPRVGIGYATEQHQQAPWRFACAGTRYVSQAKTLQKR
ncbi:MAG TPA: DNA-3-methyladenine glycosylase, partial [Polyangiales bacterium]|nr:DNA-3-methyladenine glycosylase [Polyangiales bacterium]